MTDYNVEFGSIIGPSDTNKIYDLLSVVAEGEKMHITMDQKDESDTDIFRVLRGNNFDVSQSSTNSDGRAVYTAIRKLDI